MSDDDHWAWGYFDAPLVIILVLLWWYLLTQA